MKDILVTCPPMISSLKSFEARFTSLDWMVYAPEISQSLSERDLIDLVGNYDGWIIGDDPVTEHVIRAGVEGRLRAAVRWGIGTDNLDLRACNQYGLNIPNTPHMFGAEVADLALGYVIALARQTFNIDRGVREGRWPKPVGTSLAGKTAGIVGYGDIGRQLVKRLSACSMTSVVYDPYIKEELPKGISRQEWPEGAEHLDFLVLCCGLSNETFHLVNNQFFGNVKPGLRVVNVSRGSVVDESALVKAIKDGVVHSAALDVFEVEPLQINSDLRASDRVIFGSHNASNTFEAVERASNRSIELLAEALKR